MTLESYLIRKKEKKGYIFLPYLAVGDPDWDTSLKLVDELILGGADTIEIGLPFTDPVADGPVLQRAFKRVLAQGFSMQKFFDFLKKVNKKHPDFPLVVMGYANLFFAKGFPKILKELAKHNVKGIITPDIPLEEKIRLIKKQNLEPLLKEISWIDFITPTTPEERIKRIASDSGGFLYFVSTKGVTGKSDFSLKPLRSLIKKTKQAGHVPVLIGFGIRKKEHVREAIQFADGFIIGSRIHEIIEKNIKNPSKALKELKEELKGLLPN